MNKEQTLKEKTIEQITEHFQEDAHRMIELIYIAGNKNITYQDAHNVWTFKKLAEFEHRLRQIEKVSKNNQIVPVDDIGFISFGKEAWDNFKLRMGNRCYNGLINIEDFADIIGSLEDAQI